MPHPYGYCGMPCALCSRHRASGQSRCPGCSEDGYYTDACKAHHCCRDKGVRHCGLCGDYPCKRLGGMGDFRDQNTGDAKRRACREIASAGFDAWYADYERRADLLTLALAGYNDGRMKRYLCELFLQNDLATLQEIMRRAEAIDADAPKERGKAFKAVAEALRARV